MYHLTITSHHVVQNDVMFEKPILIAGVKRTKNFIKIGQEMKELLQFEKIFIIGTPSAFLHTYF